MIQIKTKGISSFFLHILAMALMLCDHLWATMFPAQEWLTWPIIIIIALVDYLLGTIAMVDYFGAGVLTVLTFYIFHERKWWCFLGQLVCLAILNIRVIGGYFYSISLAGYEFQIVQQGFALLSLIPIWLYHGEQGYHSKGFQYVCYAFYPVHLLLLYLIWQCVI